VVVFLLSATGPFARECDQFTPLFCLPLQQNESLKPCPKKTWAVRIPDDLRPHICEIARQRCRTPAGQVTFWIERALAAEATVASKRSMQQQQPQPQQDHLAASLRAMNGET
jgi:hypothetical protein